MTNYNALEERARLQDVVPVEDYRYKAHRMKAALRGLLRQRSLIVGRDLMPGADEPKLWLTIVGAYSLLEQSLKLLVGIRTVDYLPPKEGKGTARGDGHDLAKIYRRLTDLDRGLLEATYTEYASFMEFPSAFSSLKAYLGKIGKGQVGWRYFLLQSDIAEMRELPSPLSPGMLLEITRAVLDILMAKSWTDHGPHGVHRRLRGSLGDALAHPSPLGALTSEDLNRWVHDGRGIVNAFARYLRVGVLENYSDAMRNWLNESVRIAWDAATKNNDTDLARFLNLAPTCRVAVDNGLFSFSCHRPAPVDADPRLHCDWSIEWRSNGAAWRGELDDYNHVALPTRAGQQFIASWTHREKPPQEVLSVNAEGQLDIFRGGRQLTSLRAWIMNIGGYGWGDTQADSATKTATFVVLEEEGSRAMGDGASVGGRALEGLRDLTCDDCRGTGFCPTCKGDPAGLDCGDCSRKGLCGSCHGYGRDGDHIIASSIAD